MSDLSVLIDLYGSYGDKRDLLKVLREISDRLDGIENADPTSDPSVPEKVWLVHYPDGNQVTLLESEAHAEVADGYADSYSGPYRLVPA